MDIAGPSTKHRVRPNLGADCIVLPGIWLCLTRRSTPAVSQHRWWRKGVDHMVLNALLAPSIAPAAGKSWPMQFPGSSTECEFMERAVQELARAKYGSVWRGDEPHTKLPELLPDALHPRLYNALCDPEVADNSSEPVQWFDPPRRDVLERADDLLFRNRSDLARPSSFGGMFGGLGPRPLRFTIREWKIAQVLAKKERDECLEALGRWFDLQENIVSLCESGVLESVLRPQIGGDFSPVLPKAHWRTEKYSVRFVTFMMHPLAPFSTASPQDMQWIFFTRASLRRAVAMLRNQNNVPPPASNEAYASEFMQHMVHVVLSLGITAENQPKKAVVEEAVRDLWKGAVPLSNSDVTSMASMIRLQESRAGRNRLKRTA